MDVMLQFHDAKHVCDVPNGLHELCADISREVIRVQPEDTFCFIAEYLDALLITRENTKVAMRVVQSIMLESEKIIEILSGTGLALEEIAAAAPRLQKAFRAYLDAIDQQKLECGCIDDNTEVDCDSEISICKILRQTGANYDEAWCAAVKIQALFRGHRERMSLAEKRGLVQWQRAALNTMEILRKAGITQIEATKAAIIIQAAYRGYYFRKNLRIELERIAEFRRKEKAEMDDWFRMMFENSGITIERANRAATIIQRAWREYLKRKYGDRQRDKLVSTSRTSSLKSPREKLESARDLDKTSDTSKVSTLRSELVCRGDSDEESELRAKSVKFGGSIPISSTTQEVSTDETQQVAEETEVEILMTSPSKIRFVDVDEKSERDVEVIEVSGDEPVTDTEQQVEVKEETDADVTDETDVEVKVETDEEVKKETDEEVKKESDEEVKESDVEVKEEQEDDVKEEAEGDGNVKEGADEVAVKEEPKEE